MISDLLLNSLHILACLKHIRKHAFILKNLCPYTISGRLYQHLMWFWGHAKHLRGQIWSFIYNSNIFVFFYLLKKLTLLLNCENTGLVSWGERLNPNINIGVMGILAFTIMVKPKCWRVCTNQPISLLNGLDLSLKAFIVLKLLNSV